jgi:alpha-galactosidase
MKIAFIGAGSVGFTIELARDLLKVPELQDCELALHDIDPDNLDRVGQILRGDLDANRLPTRLTAAKVRIRARSQRPPTTIADL